MTTEPNNCENKKCLAVVLRSPIKVYTTSKNKKLEAWNITFHFRDVYMYKFSSSSTVVEVCVKLFAKPKIYELISLCTYH